VNDLKAERKGDKVELTWTVPEETTDKERVRQPITSRVCRSLGGAEMSACGTPVGEVKSDSKVPPQPGGPPRRAAAFTDSLPPQALSRGTAGFSTYAVETLNDRGRGAGLSNQVRVPLSATLPPPADLKAVVAPRGVALTWSAAPVNREDAGRYRYRISRRPAGSEATTILQELAVPGTPQIEYLDSSIQWETRYTYQVTPLTLVGDAHAPTQEVEGDDAEVEILAHDVFPPASPAGLQAVFSAGTPPGFIDLTWIPNTEQDLAGYNLYRQENGGAWQKINQQLVKTPAFRDAAIVPGRKYLYSVSAVDLRGNESGRSQPAGETVPQ